MNLVFTLYNSHLNVVFYLLCCFYHWERRQIDRGAQAKRTPHTHTHTSHIVVKKEQQTNKLFNFMYTFCFAVTSVTLHERFEIVQYSRADVHSQSSMLFFLMIGCLCLCACISHCNLHSLSLADSNITPSDSIIRLAVSSLWPCKQKKLKTSRVDRIKKKMEKKLQNVALRSKRMRLNWAKSSYTINVEISIYLLS